MFDLVIEMAFTTKKEARAFGDRVLHMADQDELCAQHTIKDNSSPIIRSKPMSKHPERIWLTDAYGTHHNIAVNTTYYKAGDRKTKSNDLEYVLATVARENEPQPARSVAEVIDKLRLKVQKLEGVLKDTRRDLKAVDAYVVQMDRGAKEALEASDD